MRYAYKMLVVSALLFIATAAVIAQVATNATAILPGALPIVTADVPGFWTLGIALVTPVIVYGIKRIAPNVPSALLPVITPVIGIALGFAINWLQAKNLAYVDMAQAGALAVFIREVWNQSITKPVAAAKENAIAELGHEQQDVKPPLPPVA